MDTPKISILSSQRPVGETFRFWLLSFLGTPASVHVGSFAGAGRLHGTSDLYVVLLFCAEDLHDASLWIAAVRPALRPTLPLIAVAPPGEHGTLFQAISRRFFVTVGLEKCMGRILATLHSRGWATSACLQEEHSRLTERELQVLDLVARGAPLKEISYRLGISQHTVVSHRRNLYLKTGARTLQQLALYATLHLASREDD
ncbi:MAG: helix-turn-helix transcriptional regulator [Sphaerochaetaceae bacterium]|nr:helix-turn-helix transcriptional regulator [Sphaerochaetaceae bacterium]MDX9939006.1 helix-turn-helix transcriptional regulator [Sphaerochaetaceae bacterium]